jgi:hypothetical protein
MESFLKTDKVRIESLGREFDIRELSARAQIELIELGREGRAEDSAAVVCRYGVVGWEQETPEAIESSLPPKALTDLARAIYKLSGVDLSKNSVGALSDDSSSDSQLNSVSRTLEH